MATFRGPESTATSGAIRPKADAAVPKAGDTLEVVQQVCYVWDLN
jgi:hypothetical protein